MVAASSSRGDPQEAAARAAARQAQEKTVRAKVACDKAAFQTQWKLIEETVSEPTLTAAAQLLQPQHYDDVVEERALDLRCGYPCCGNAVKQRKPMPQYHISVSERKVYEVDGLYRFCSVECAQRSCSYRSRIPPTSLFLRGGLNAATDALRTLQIDTTLHGATIERTKDATGAGAEGCAGSSGGHQARDCVSSGPAAAPCAKQVPGSTSAGSGNSGGDPSASRPVAKGVAGPTSTGNGNSSGDRRAVRAVVDEGDAPRMVPQQSTGAASSNIPPGFLAGRVVEREPGPKPPQPLGAQGRHDTIEGHEPRNVVRAEGRPTDGVGQQENASVRGRTTTGQA